MDSNNARHPGTADLVAGAPGDPATPLRALLIEDDPDDAYMIERMLTENLKQEVLLHRVMRMEELDDALRSDWDLVLCDYSLPGFTAREAIEAVRRIRPGSPIVIVSGAVGEEEAAALIRSGAHDFVMKSNLSRLSPAVERCLREVAASRFTLRAEKAYANIVEHSYQALFVVQHGRIVFANRAAAELADRSLADLLSLDRRRILELIKEPDREMVSRAIEALIEGRAANEMFTCRVASRTEGTRILEVYGSTMEFDGRPAAHLAAIDVTERIQLEEALMRGKREWERTFDAVRELIVITDQRNRIIRLNRAMANRMDTHQRELVGLQWEDVSGIPAERWRMSRDDEAQVRDMEVISDSLGGRFHFSSTPRTDENGVLLGAIHVGRDVTARRQTEEVIRRQTAIDQTDQIFRTFRHELGNALNTLKTTLAVYRRNVDAFDRGKRETYLDRCLDALHLAERLLFAVRTYQTLDEVRLHPMDAVAFLRRESGLLFERSRSKGVECRFVTRADVLPVLADRDALLRVLLNLLDNATSACDGVSSPVIEVVCGARLTEAVIEVRDNGCGIPFEDLDQVFSPFVTTKDDGSGMGLAIVQKLMVRMNGLAQIDRTPRSGTTIELRLPLAKAGSRE